jgi:hypothetical protein
MSLVMGTPIKMQVRLLIENAMEADLHDFIQLIVGHALSNVQRYADSMSTNYLYSFIV